ncbi:MAG: hypothetical protein P1R58_10100 [bacterium]|nr:hypothetical protein [bacterium]
MRNYPRFIAERLWEYADAQLPMGVLVPERTREKGGPPVFKDNCRYLNVLANSSNETLHVRFVGKYIGTNKYHQWFGSMKSSQALAVSVFGNLSEQKQLSLLEQVSNAEGVYPFRGIGTSNLSLELEHAIDKKLLWEKVSTSVDAQVKGKLPIYIECKFTESEIGACSMPIEVKDRNGNITKEAQCDGNYATNHTHNYNCPLTDKGIKYWELIPNHTNLRNELAYIPCPIRHNYQLIRNSLVAALNKGRVVLVYDDRNPSFCDGGDGILAFHSCKNVLKKRDLLQRVSWQQINVALADNKETQWLADSLTAKYGF